MSSDGYFDGDELNDAIFEELDAIEAAASLNNKERTRGATLEHAATKPITKESSFYDLTFDVDEEELQKLDNFIEDAYQGKVQPVAGPSRTTSKSTVQTTLFGDVLPKGPTPNKPRSQIQRTKSAPRNPFGQQAPKTKTWDHTSFAKTGLKPKPKSKAKAKGGYDSGEEYEEELVEFEQFPAPFITPGPLPPMKLVPDMLEAKHWIFPLNQPKRDYQYNIVKHCLFDNTIVALPTGLGKTFVAGVVMLNFYRWFPEGKVVFVAPTKPLVAQQIDASHQTCGIPGSDAVELTGAISRAVRHQAWKEKRVFYMTPQTLVNDLVTENCDARDIILLVIDEAHRATGNYSYNQAVRFLMSRNPYFRILALTATPGGNPEAVQALIDGLHISHIEIRDENSLDLKAYIHHKEIKQHIIQMTEDVNKIKLLLSNLMDVDIKPLRQRGVLYSTADPAKMHPYSAQARMSSLTKDQKWAYGPLARLASLARAMGYLIEGTLGMCYTYMQKISKDDGGDAKGAAAARSKKLRSDPLFQAVMQELEKQRSRGFSIHPKMDLLKTLVVQHFGGKMGDDKTEAEETRVMVFVTFREAVDEIVEALNFERPLIRAHKFIGQGEDKQGNKGLAQKEQLEVIKKFKSGELNVLVATSIGEEGLDIGEVDLIVCYDAQKTPIRMLQRVGRTGRKRAGYVHVLLAEGREELNLDKAKETYKEVQKTIWSGDQLELYADVERLLPEYIKPQCLEKKMEIQEYVREEGRRRGKTNLEDGSPKKGAKRKRNDDVLRNIPTGASTGFVSVAELLVKGAKKRKKVIPPKDFESAGQDDETDMEIESGIISGISRTKSLAASTSKPTKVKPKLRKASTIDGTRGKKKKEKPVEMTSSQISNQCVDDSDDADIEQGTIVSRAAANRCPPPRPISQRLSPERQTSLIPSTLSVDVVTKLPTPDLEDDPEPDQRLILPLPEDLDQSMAWLVDEDEDFNIDIIDSSPVIGTRKFPPTVFTDDESVEFVESQGSTLQGYQQRLEVDDSIEFVETNVLKSLGKQKAKQMVSQAKPLERTPELDESIEFMSGHVSLQDTPSSSPPKWQQPRSPQHKLKHGFYKSNKPLLISHKRNTAHSNLMDENMPESSFPVRHNVRQTKKRQVIIEDIESPVLEMPPPSQRRLHRRRESPLADKFTRKPKSKDLRTDIPFDTVFDNVAIHSGDETSEGSSHSEEDMESESDRLFLEELPETQVSPSYDQSMVYRQSLLTQAPASAKAPNFANRPVRHGVFGARLATSPQMRRPIILSSPQADNSEPDEYVLDSFVVDDEAEISYLSS